MDRVMKNDPRKFNSHLLILHKLKEGGKPFVRQANGG